MSAIAENGMIATAAIAPGGQCNDNITKKGNRLVMHSADAT
jgi:hypothetical protein